MNYCILYLYLLWILHYFILEKRANKQPKIRSSEMRWCRVRRGERNKQREDILSSLPSLTAPQFFKKYLITMRAM